MFWHTRRSGASKARRATPVLVLVAVAAAIGGFSTIGGANTGGSSGPLGAYAGALAPGSVSSFGRSLGQQPAFAMDFLNGSSWSTMVDSAPTYMSTWSGSGYKMVWGVPILPNSFHADSNPSDTSGSAYGLEQGAAGAYNSYYLKLAQEMVAGGQGSSIVRPGWEFNGNWFPWAAKGAAAAFVGYWQQIVNTMRSVPGQDFKFEWNPSRGRPRSGGPRRLLSRERVCRLHRPGPLRPVMGDVSRDRVGMEHLSDRAIRAELVGVVRRLRGEAHHASRVGPRPRSVVQRRGTGLTPRQ